MKTRSKKNIRKWCGSSYSKAHAAWRWINGYGWRRVTRDIDAPKRKERLK